jgi:hypothetical protein
MDANKAAKKKKYHKGNNVIETKETRRAFILGIWEFQSSLFTRYTSTAAHTGAVKSLKMKMKIKIKNKK